MDFNDLPIEEDFNESENYSSVVERYYSPRFCMDVCLPRDDYCILIHSNRVCLVTLAPSHYLFKQRDIVSVSFQVSENTNRLKNKVSGKWKHGAQMLNPQSALALVTSSSGESYTLRSGICGKLLEVNQQLLQDPNLMLSESQGKGHIAIVLPDIPKVQQYRDNLLSSEDYKEKCRQLDDVS